MRNDAGGPVDLEAIDLDRYDFPGLREDVNEILDLQGSVVRILRWTVLVPIVGAILTWSVFDPRMSPLVLVPYVVLVAVAMVVMAFAIGVAIVLRSKVAETNTAADRVVTTVASLHGDYLRIKSGEVELPMRELAQVLTTELVFPALIAGSGTAFASAMMTTGPAGMALRWIGRPALGAVERRVLDALSEVDGPEPGSEPAAVADSTPVDGSELVAATLTPDLPPELAGWYDDIHRYLTRLIDLADTVTDGSTTTLVAVAALPTVILLVAGWALT